MPSEQAAAGGGSGGNFLSNAYNYFEDKYYALVDYLEDAGVPVGGLVDSFESRGIRTFPIAVLSLLLVIFLAYWLALPRVPTETDFVLTVFSGDSKVSKAVVHVYLDEELISSANSNEEGAAFLEALPTRELKFAISARGYAQANRTFDLSARSRASVELECVGANCVRATPTPVEPATPTPPIIVSPPPTPIPTLASPTPEPPKPVSFSVYVKNVSSKNPVEGAAVELRKSGTSRLLGSVSTDANGLAFFEEIEFGTSAYLIVSATGFIKYNGVVANQKVTLDKEGKSIDVLLETTVIDVTLVPTLFKLFDENGNPITAFVEFYLNNSDTPYSSATVNGQGTYRFPAGSRITAVVYPTDSSAYGGGSVSFNAGDSTALVSLARINVVDPALISCDVLFPSSPATGQAIVSPGQRLPVSIKFSSRPLAPVTVYCGNQPAIASCVGTACSTQCVFDSPGTKAIRADSGNASCTSGRQLLVEQRLRSYSIVASPGVIQLGNKTNVLVTFVDPANAQGGGMTISCGEGAPVQANCGETAGTCTAECGPYNTPGSKAILAIVGSEVVAAATVFVGGGYSCNLLLSPLAPVEQQPVQVLVQFNYSQSVNGFLLECGGRPQTIGCSGKVGACSGACSFDSPGSHAVVARSGSQPACAGTVFVNSFQPPPGVTTCADSARTPLNSCSQGKPVFCNRFGRLESRASRCGCPEGWRVSPASPDFCEKLRERRVIGFVNGTLSTGRLFDGKISGLAQVLGVRNGSTQVFSLVAGVPVGADSLVALVDGNLISASASSTGLIQGAGFAVGVKADGKPLLPAVAGGKMPAEIKKVLVVSGGAISLRDTASDGSLSAPNTVSSVAGASGGYLEVIALDGGPTQCFDGTLVGECSAEKPFACNGDGWRSPKPSQCGCPTGWRVRAADSEQCEPIPPTGQACSDGTPDNACSIAARPLKCENGLLKPMAVECGCPTGFNAEGEQCVQTIPAGGTRSQCADTTPVNSCSGFKPLQCNSQGKLVSSPAQCGCPTVAGKQFVVRNAQCAEPPPAVCADGRTVPGSCKAGDQPWFCNEDGASYSTRASACSCPSVRGVQWVADGERCIPPPPEFCPDGVTRRNACKLGAQPLFCLNNAGGYVEKASECSCPTGYTLVGEACIPFQPAPACSVDVFPKIVYPNAPNAAKIFVSQTGFTGVAPAQVNASCDNGERAALSFDSRLNAFVGSCTFPPTPANGLSDRLYTAKISVPQAFALCTATPPGNVRVLALPPTHCSDSFNAQTPVGSCVAGHLPYYCSVEGSEFNGFFGKTVSNAIACGCPANHHREGDACVSDVVPTKCLDNTLVGECSGLGGLGKPFRCVKPDAVGQPYNASLVPDASGANSCGCPPNKVVKEDNCVVPAQGSLAVGVEGSSFKTTEPITASLLLSNFNFPLAEHKNGLQVSCGDADGSGVGDELFERSKCTTRPNGDLNCAFSCTYRAGENGNKKISASFTAGGVVFTANSNAFPVSGWPGGSCSIASDNSNIHLGDRAVVAVNFATPFDVNGVRQSFAGSQGGRYSFHCGNVFSPTLNAQANLAPITALNCVGAAGACSATCEYLPAQIDLTQTTSTRPQFSAFAGTPFDFSCSGPLVRILNTPAVAKVLVKHDGRPVPGADVVLREKIGFLRNCNTGVTDGQGAITFTHCVSSTGERRTILKDSEFEATASISVVGGESSISMEGSSPTARLLAQSSAGVNEIIVAIDFAAGKVSLNAIDALTQGVTENLSKATNFTVRCPQVELSTPPRLTALTRAVGNCTGAVCNAASRVLMNCFVDVAAVGYRGDSYGQAVISSPNPASQANSVALTAVLVPLSFKGNSLHFVKEVYDLEGSLSETRQPGPVSSQLVEGALFATLKKGFRYRVTTTLTTIAVAPTNRVAAFLQAGRNKESYIISNTDSGLFYLPEHSKGQLYEESGQCSSSEVNYEDAPQPRFYDWVELHSSNRRAGGSSFAPEGVEFDFQIVPNEFVAAPSSALRARSFSFNASSRPAFVLDPFDAEALNASRHPAIPFCGAVAREYNYGLEDSVRKCSSDLQYCVESVFLQPGVSSKRQGDGFVAQSALKCAVNNSGHCVDVLARFTLTNNDLRLADPVTAPSYHLSFSTQAERYEVKEIRLSGGRNAAGTETSFARITGLGEVLVFKPGRVLNLTDSGVVTTISSNSFELNLNRQFVQGLWGNLRPEVSGEIVLKPLHPTPDNGRATTAITFSSPSKSARLEQWTLIVPRSGVRTVYGEVMGVPLVRQLEQADYEDASLGFNQYAAAAFSNTTQFNASAFDCNSASVPSTALKGYSCKPVELSFTAKAYQELEAAQIVFSDASNSFQITELQFNVSDASGSLKPGGKVAVPASGSLFTHSLGRLSIGESISVLMTVKPPAGGELLPKPVTIGVRNASNEDSALNVTGFMGSSKRYGLLRVQARDALDSQLLAGTVEGGVRRNAASFALHYAGRQRAEDNCVLSGEDSCIYRLKALKWPSPCAFDSSNQELRGAGCLRVNAPPGYFAPSLQRLAEDSIGDNGQPASGTVVAGQLKDFKVFVLKALNEPSSVQRVEVRTQEPVSPGEVANPNGIACQSNSEDARVPDCFTKQFSLVRDRAYTLKLYGTFKQSEKGGLYLALGEDFSQARLLGVPLALKLPSVKCGSACVAGQVCQTICPVVPSQASSAGTAGGGAAGASTASGGNAILPIASYAGSTTTGVCTAFTDNPSGLIARGVNWVQLVTDNSGVTGAPGAEFPFEAEYAFVVPEFFEGDALKLSLNSFAANRSLFGRELYFRTPQDPRYEFDFERQGKLFCQAATRDLTGRPVDGSTSCNSLSCISVQLEQGESLSSSPPSGFEAVSKNFWLTWTDAPYPALKYKFRINIVRQTQSKAIVFTLNPLHARITGFKLDKFCGLGVEGRGGSLSGDGKTFTLNANSCTSIAGVEEIAGEFTLETLPQDVGTTLELQYRAAANDFTSQATAIRIVRPEGLEQNNYASVSADVSQKQVGLQDGIPLRSLVRCSPTAGSCSGKRFLSTFGNDCTLDGIDNAFSERGAPFCHASWLEFIYAIKSIPAAPSASASFKIVSGDAVIAPIPSSGISTRAAFLVRRIGGVPATVALTPSADGKSVSASVGSVALGEEFSLVVRVNPRSSGVLHAVLKFDNGKATEVPLFLRVEGRRVQQITCPGALCPDIVDIHPCGRADLSVSVSPALGAQLRVTPSCTRATLLVDPIFPVDAIPFGFDQAFRDACVAGGTDPFESQIYRFDVIPSSELPAGVRQLDATHFSVDKVRKAIVFNGLDFGLRHNKIVGGNKILWPSSQPGAPGTPIAPGAEIGRARLVISCPLLGNSVAIDVSLKANSLVAQGPDGEQISLLNAIDASGIFFQNQAHQLVWASYNGQFPQDLAVQASNEGREVSVPFNANDRVKFFLTNSKAPNLRMAGSFPLSVIPKGEGEVRQPPIALPSASQSLQKAVESGGIVLRDAVHRPGNIVSGLVGEAHRDPEVNAAFREFVDQGIAFPEEPTTCSAIDYVSKVYRQLPAAFKSFAKKIGFETAFRRTKRPDDVLSCAFVKVDAPFYCNQNGRVAVNPVVCGCPYNFRKTANGLNCEPISNALHPPGACADGTLVGQCSKYKPFYCSEQKLLVENPSQCSPAVASSEAGKCFEGTPFNSCLRQEGRGLVCRADLASWRIQNIEVEMREVECSACARVSAPYVASCVSGSADCAPSPLVTLSAQGTIAGSTSLFKPGSTAQTAFATVIEDQSVLVRAVVSSSLEVQVGAQPQVRLEYQRPGKTECQQEGTAWCGDGRLFESGAEPLLPAELASSGQAPVASTFSKRFELPPEVGTASSELVSLSPAEGTWVVRAVVSYVEPSGASKTLYSPPVQLVLARRSRACVDGASEKEFSCTDSDNDAWCDVACASGRKSVPVRAGPGILSGEQDIWLNATPVEPFRIPAITNIDNYAGTPFKHFINPELQPFSFSMPLMTWSSKQLSEWDAGEVFQGYSLPTPPCGEGIGFYELQASAKTGVGDWQYSAKLESLPLRNYLLNTEPSDGRDFDPSKPYDFLGGSFGCQMHSEHSSYDYSTLTPAQETDANRATRPPFWTPVSASDLLERHEKPLCNVRIQAVTQHAQKCGDGLCECVNFNKQRFGGNCGCDLPGCGGSTGNNILPVCDELGQTTARQVPAGTKVCPGEQCVELAYPPFAGKCACTGQFASCASALREFPELRQEYGRQGFACKKVLAGSASFTCTQAGCGLLLDKKGRKRKSFTNTPVDQLLSHLKPSLGVLGVSSNANDARAVCVCPTLAEPGACVPIPANAGAEAGKFACRAARSIAGGFTQECNPSFCRLEYEPAGCSEGPIVISG